LKQKILRSESGGFFVLTSLFLETLHDGVTIIPGDSRTNTTTAQQNDDDGDNDQGCIVLLGLFGDWGHLIVHNYFSSME
jgi:hypothetical protein